MVTGRQSLAAGALPDGRVLAIGGYSSTGSYLTSVESYIISGNLWR